MLRVRATILVCCLLAGGGACEPSGRSVRAWIESRDPGGAIVAGASVEVDGQPLGITDQRGLFRLKVRRRVGSTVSLVLQRDDLEGGAPDRWAGTFTVGTDGTPAEFPGGRVVAVLGETVATDEVRP